MSAGPGGRPGRRGALAHPVAGGAPFANLSADKENEYFGDGLAEDIIDAQARVLGRSSFALGNLDRAYASTGRTAEALTLLEELQERAHTQDTPSWSVAVVQSGQGEMDKAFDWFEKAVGDHDPLMLHFHVHPDYDPAHAHPRRAALLPKINLPQRAACGRPSPPIDSTRNPGHASAHTLR